MTKFNIHQGRRSRWPMRLIVVVGTVLLALVIAAVVVHRDYSENLRPVSSDAATKVFAVSSGATVNQIATGLHRQGLIRQAWAFERYVKDHNLGSELQAGTYRLSPSQDVPQIAEVLATGKVAVNLITILPGQRIDQIREAFIKAKFDPAAVDAALNPAQYADSPALADKPASASLEGFLYPDSYQKDANTDPRTIIEASLAELETRLTPARRQQFAARGLTVYQAVTLASIVEREVSNNDDRSQVAQVFYKRMQQGMSLESDVTAFYGAIKDGKPQSVDYDSPYNTYKINGLPVGPISNVSESSLDAVAEPANTDWTYFVAGDDGKTYFSKTLDEHEALTEQHCKKLCNL